MRPRARGAACVLLLAGACAPARPPAGPGPADGGGARVAAYYASWSARDPGLAADAVPAAGLTHLLYAFATIDAEGRAALGDPCADVGACGAAAGDSLGGNLAALRRLRARAPHLRVLASIGGWDGSARFSEVAATDEGRRRFARSVVDLFLVRWPGIFDGVDVDWEFPVEGGRPGNAARPGDGANLTRLLAELRAALDAQGARDGRRYLLTAAVPASPAAASHLELHRLPAYVDWLTLMAYDFHTGDAVTHFNAPLFAAPGDPTPDLTVDAATRRYLAAGVPPRKLVLGVPFFGYGFGGVRAEGDGLFRPAAGAPPETWGVGPVPWRELAGDAPERRGFRRYRSEAAGVPWMYDPAARVWIGYDDPRSIERKGRYAREAGLGGVAVWEISQDDGTLLPALRRGLGAGGR